MPTNGPAIDTVCLEVAQQQVGGKGAAFVRKHAIPGVKNNTIELGN